MTRTRSTNKGRLRSMEELPTGGSQPSLCVAYLILTGTSGWALKHTSTSQYYAMGTFSFLLGHSLIGFLHTTHPDPGDVVQSIFKQTAMLAEVAPLALINAEFYLISGFGNEYAYGHVATAFLPLVIDLTMDDYTRTVMDLTALANIGSMTYLYVSKELGVWTAGLIALATLNHFAFKQICSRYDVPKIEIVTIGLSFFTVFALTCLKDLKA